MVNALLSGENKRQNGILRQWQCVEYHGNINQVKGDALLQVIDNGNVRQINMSSFIGVILYDNEEQYFFLGECISKECYDIQTNLPF
jgi:hypothetical protein